MTDRETIILDAAVQVFSRYGVRRTSMGDLAEEAGVSRQTLYNAYRNKDDILRGLIRRYAEQTVAEIEAALDTTDGLGARLDLVFEKTTLAPYDLMAASPNAEDLVEGFNASSQQELAAAAESHRILISRILAPFEAALTEKGMSVADLSDFVQRSAKAAKTSARDRDHLVRQLATLKKLCLIAATS